MNTTDFTFRLTAYDVDRYLPQVRAALEKRTELLSRSRFPSLWRLVDKLNASHPGKDHSKLLPRFVSLFCLAVGVILLVPGLMKPQELQIPLIAGIAAIVIGIVGLWRNRTRKKDPFEQAAKVLLRGKDALTPEQSIEVSFFETAMMLPGGEDNCVLYEDFQCVIETADLFLPVFGTRALVLQKRDLPAGSEEAFREFLSAAVSEYCVLA